MEAVNRSYTILNLYALIFTKLKGFCSNFLQAIPKLRLFDGPGRTSTSRYARQALSRSAAGEFWDILGNRCVTHSLPINSAGAYGLLLDCTFSHNSSATCPAYDNDVLCRVEACKCDRAFSFDCVGLEVWGT
jgi:hypothetical protein